MRIEARTGFRARASDDFKADTVRWILANSEDVGDIETMLSIAILVGFGRYRRRITTLSLRRDLCEKLTA